MSGRTVRILCPGEGPEADRVRAALAQGTLSAPHERGCDIRIFTPPELAAAGARALRRFRLRHPGVPMLAIIPAEADGRLVRDCFREGAADVLEPAETGELPRLVAAALERARAGLTREGEVQRMAAELGKRARDLETALDSLSDSYEQTLVALVTALDHRERETACHSQRVAAYAVAVGLRLGLDDSDLRNLHRGALLHDIGKIGIPDSILLKPGGLSEEDWKIMRGHAELGASLVRRISFLRPAADVPWAHHEAWDGSGYPRGLQATAIPLHARIFAVVDSYDALRSERPYKPSMRHAEAVAALQEARAQRLDPELVDVFLAEPQETWERLGLLAGEDSTFPVVLRSCREVCR